MGVELIQGLWTSLQGKLRILFPAPLDDGIRLLGGFQLTFLVAASLGSALVLLFFCIIFCCYWQVASVV